jgi:phosphoribosylglycinamide formyltransferase-1
VKVGVLVSGSGTNLQALLDAAGRGELGPARIAVVGSNVPGCGGLTRAQAAGIPTFAVDHRSFAARELFDQALVEYLRAHDVEAVVLAGFMRILTAAFLDAFPQRVINIHPALLPSFPGVRSQQQAFERGVKIAGCTVHFADGGTDSGPIIAQAAVPVLEGDDAEALRLRILAEEHRLLPAAVRAMAEGRLAIQGHRVRVTGATGVTDASRLATL